MRESLRIEPQAVGTRGKQTLPEALTYTSMGCLIFWLIALNLALYWYRHDDAGQSAPNAVPLAVSQTSGAERASTATTLPPATASSVAPA